MADQAAIIRWEAPPPARGRTACAGRQVGRYDRVALDLIGRPGEPALIRICRKRYAADNLAMAIRRGWISSFPAGDFQAVSRTVGGQHRVYAWYLGDGEAL